MLQINTGKLYSRGIGRTNKLRGILYSNGWIIRDEDIVTRAGVLKGAGFASHKNALVYELVENMEAEEDGPGILLSHGVMPYLEDMAAIASFYLQIFVSSDYDLVQRTIYNDKQYSTYDLPRNFVSRFFDQEVPLVPEQGASFSQFVDRLLALERRYFLGAMRAIRTYVAAMQSITFDLALSYTLLVSAAETLVQKFDDYESDWIDVEIKKRRNVDLALENIPEKEANAVRDAIVSSDHHALSRRYREFVLSTIDGDYFRNDEPNPVARWQLPIALKQAYAFRSKYIHSAQPLPQELTMPVKNFETREVDRLPAFSFQGLNRVTRHAILSFVGTSPKIEKEIYDYSLERSGVAQVQLAAQYWVASPITDAGHVRRRLEGFLGQLADAISNEDETPITDLRPILGSLEQMYPQAEDKYRPAIYAVYVLFNAHAGPKNSAKNWQNFEKKISEVFARPVPEIFITYTILNGSAWDISKHQEAYNNYWTQRITRSGFRAPALFEAAACLVLAERYRQIGDEGKTTQLIDTAVECNPANKHLIEYERNFKMDEVISWSSILLPKNTEKSASVTQDS